MEKGKTIRTGHSVSSNTMSLISVDDIVAEDRDRSRVKGKGLLIHPSSYAINAGTIHNDSSPATNYEEASGSFNKPRNSFETRGEKVVGELHITINTCMV
ncbi:hypothetical protein RYX36_025004 [Vicia faba]